MSSEIMAFVFAPSRRNIWPFSKIDSDLRDSKELVQRLAVPASTKTFVFAIRVPEHDSTIYILSAQNLSQRSATDAECLIRELRPDAVVAQVNKSAFGPAQAEEIVSGDGSTETIPTSAFKVITRCILDESFNTDKYEAVAGNLVMEEIFGTSFNGHLVAAKKVADEVGSSFRLLESPFVMEGLDKSLTTEHYYGYAISPTRFQLTNKEFRPSSCVANETESESYAVQPFALSTYNLLVELHNRFNALPALRRALNIARKMLSDVNKGEAIDREALSEFYIFRNAVEGIRIALNNVGRLPTRNLSDRTQVQFSKLSSEEKSYALMADQLRSQAKKFKNIVAVVDASNLAGLRRHWETVVPQEVKDRSTDHTVQDSDGNQSKLVAAVGVGALTISKAIRAPASLNVFLTHTHKAMTFASTKLAYPTKVMTGGKSMSLATASLSAKEIIGAALARCIIYSTEDKSLSTMRDAFYRMMMRRRRAKPVGTLPLVMFGASLVTCAGLLYHEEGIECAAVTLPSARSIARLGRGIQNLREASREVTRREDNKIQNAMGGLSQRLRDFVFQYSISLNFKTRFGS